MDNLHDKERFEDKSLMFFSPLKYKGKPSFEFKLLLNKRKSDMQLFDPDDSKRQQEEFYILEKRLLNGIPAEILKKRESFENETTKPNDTEVIASIKRELESKLNPNNDGNEDTYNLNELMRVCGDRVNKFYVPQKKKRSRKEMEDDKLKTITEDINQSRIFDKRLYYRQMIENNRRQCILRSHYQSQLKRLAMLNHTESLYKRIDLRNNNNESSSFLVLDNTNEQPQERTIETFEPKQNMNQQETIDLDEEEINTNNKTKTTFVSQAESFNHTHNLQINSTKENFEEKKEQGESKSSIKLQKKKQNSNVTSDSDNELDRYKGFDILYSKRKKHMKKKEKEQIDFERRKEEEREQRKEKQRQNKGKKNELVLKNIDKGFTTIRDKNRAKLQDTIVLDDEAIEEDQSSNRIIETSTEIQLNCTMDIENYLVDRLELPRCNFRSNPNWQPERIGELVLSKEIQDNIRVDNEGDEEDQQKLNNPPIKTFRLNLYKLKKEGEDNFYRALTFQYKHLTFTYRFPHECDTKDFLPKLCKLIVDDLTSNVFSNINKNSVTYYIGLSSTGEPKLTDPMSFGDAYREYKKRFQNV